jgi:hypothetical protein
MIKEIEIGISPEFASNHESIKEHIYQSLGLSDVDFTYKIWRRSIDARGKTPLIRLKCQLFISEQMPMDVDFDPQWQAVNHKKKVIMLH